MDSPLLLLRRAGSAVCEVSSQVKVCTSSCLSSLDNHNFLDKKSCQHLDHKRLVVLACTAALLAVGIYGITQLDINFSIEQYFDIKEGSIQDKFLETKKMFEVKEQAAVLLGNFDYTRDVDKITSLLEDLDALDSVEVPFKEMWLASFSSADNFAALLKSPFGQSLNMSEDGKQIEAAFIPFTFLAPPTTSKGMALADEIDALVEAQVKNPSMINLIFLKSS